MKSDVVVIGAGIAGYAAALRLRRAGASVTLVSAGLGGLPLSTGTVDVLGYLGGSAGVYGEAADQHERRRIARPLETIESAELLPAWHPYRRVGAQNVRAGASHFAELVGPDLLTDRSGDDGENHLLASAVGAVRPSYLIQPSMAAGDLRAGGKYVVVGLARLKDLPAELVAGNLNRAELPGGGKISARPLTIDLEIREGEHDTSPLNHARGLDQPRVRERLATALEGRVFADETVLLPAVLGMDNPGVAQELSARLGVPVAEIPTVPPSVPGVRLENRLNRLAASERVRTMQGGAVVGHETTADGKRLESVTVASSGHPQKIQAEQFVLAAGGFESGALHMDSYGTITDTVLGLPLVGATEDATLGAARSHTPTTGAARRRYSWRG